MAGTITHSWNGTILTITSDSGTTAMDLKGKKGDTGARGARGLPGKAGGGARIEDGVISDETTWSSSGIIDRFAELMGTNANPAVLDNPYPNFPLQITTTFESKQSGSGEPSPDNIRPISGFDSVKLTRCGKNLINPQIDTDNYYASYTTNNADGSITVNNSSSSKVYPATVWTWLPSGTYTAQFTRISGSNPTEVFLQCNDTSDYSSNIAALGVKTFTVSEETRVRFMVIAEPSASYTASIQIEQGSTATAYEPYQGDTFTIALGDTYYDGMLDWNSGEMVVDKMGITLNGNEEWTKSTYGNHYNMPLTDIVPTDENINHIVCCSHCIGIPYVDRENYTKLVAGITNDNKIEFRNTGYETIEGWKAYLAAQNTAGTPIQIVYKLATQTTIQLTPQEIKAIKGINTLYSNAQELTVIGRVDTMYQLSKLAERVAALESR